MNGKHFVYVYRSGEKVRYVGYGADSERAFAHPDGHHDRLRARIASNACEVTVAGPYRDEEEDRRIEAALISALDRSSTPPPVAVRSSSDRCAARAQRPAERGPAVARRARPVHPRGGALVVYLSPGNYLSDDRPKFDPADPADDIVQSNIQEAWEIGPHLDEWLDGEYSGPQLLVGVSRTDSRPAPPASTRRAGATRTCCANAGCTASLFSSRARQSRRVRAARAEGVRREARKLRLAATQVSGRPRGCCIHHRR